MNTIFVVSVATGPDPTPQDFRTIGTAPSMPDALRLVADHAQGTATISQEIKIEATGTMRALTIKLTDPSQVQINPMDTISYK